MAKDQEKDPGRGKEKGSAQKGMQGKSRTKVFDFQRREIGNCQHDITIDTGACPLANSIRTLDVTKRPISSL
jgi:hypothetical protein